MPTEPSDREELSVADLNEAEERAHPSAPVLYNVTRLNGEEELERPTSALLWSGFVAGLAMFSSVAMEAFLLHKMGDHPLRAAIADLGYTLGFVIVVIGRMQLFTEATITAVVPLISNPSRETLWGTARLWTIVLLANLVGTFAAALLTVHAGLATAPQLESLLSVSRVVLEHGGVHALTSGVPAGFIIAAMVWVLPNAKPNALGLVVLFTWFIALGDFAHVIAGSAEAWLLWLAGEASFWQVTGGYVLPALAGNIIGGTLLFTLLTYAQVREEL